MAALTVYEFWALKRVLVLDHSARLQRHFQSSPNGEVDSGVPVLPFITFQSLVQGKQLFCGQPSTKKQQDQKTQDLNHARNSGDKAISNRTLGIMDFSSAWRWWAAPRTSRPYHNCSQVPTAGWVKPSKRDTRGPSCSWLKPLAELLQATPEKHTHTHTRKPLWQRGPIFAHPRRTHTHIPCHITPCSN